MLVSEFITAVQGYMDAEDSNRWPDALIKQVGGMVMATEWSTILDQNRFYRMQPAVAVTTDSDGRIAVNALTTGSADSTKNFYRVLTGFTDGNVLWTETDLNYVPLATQINYTSPYEYRFYLAGDYFQLLPVQNGLQLTVPVSWTPPTIAELAGDTSAIDFPTSFEWILVFVTAGTLLMKGGAESQAASDLFTLADSARKNMLGSIGRRTVRPTYALFPDSSSNWQ